MKNPHCAHPDQILFGKNLGAQRYRCQTCGRIFKAMSEARIPPSEKHAQKLHLGGLGLRTVGRILGVHYKTISCWLVQAAGQLPVDNPRRRIVPLLRSMNSAALSLKKSKCWNWVAIDSTVSKVLGFVCGNCSIKTARKLFKQLRGLPTMG